MKNSDKRVNAVLKFPLEWVAAAMKERHLTITVDGHDIEPTEDELRLAILRLMVECDMELQQCRNIETSTKVNGPIVVVASRGGISYYISFTPVLVRA